MTRKTVTNQSVTPSGGCGCGHAADHSHEHEAHAGHGCCDDAASHANPTRQHERGCCGGSHVSQTGQNADGVSAPDKGVHP